MICKLQERANRSVTCNPEAAPHWGGGSNAFETIRAHYAELSVHRNLFYLRGFFDFPFLFKLFWKFKQNNALPLHLRPVWFSGFRSSWHCAIRESEAGPDQRRGRRYQSTVANYRGVRLDLSVACRCRLVGGVSHFRRGPILSGSYVGFQATFSIFF